MDRWKFITIGIILAIILCIVDIGLTIKFVGDLGDDQKNGMKDTDTSREFFRGNLSVDISYPPEVCSYRSTFWSPPPIIIIEVSVCLTNNEKLIWIGGSSSNDIVNVNISGPSTLMKYEVWSYSKIPISFKLTPGQSIYSNHTFFYPEAQLEAGEYVINVEVIPTGQYMNRTFQVEVYT